MGSFLLSCTSKPVIFASLSSVEFHHPADLIQTVSLQRFPGRYYDTQPTCKLLSKSSRRSHSNVVAIYFL